MSTATLPAASLTDVFTSTPAFPTLSELGTDEYDGFIVRALPDDEPAWDAERDRYRPLAERIGELRAEIVQLVDAEGASYGAAFGYVESVIASAVASETDFAVRKSMLDDAAEGLAAFSRRYATAAQAKRALRPLVYGPDEVRAKQLARTRALLDA